MPNSASEIAELAAGLQSYRGEMADALRTSLAFVERYLSLWGIDDRFDASTGMRDNIDLSRGMRAIVGALAANTRLHAIACLRANDMNNLHSLAVQMRPALECAGQIRIYMESVLEKRVDVLDRYFNSTYFQLVKHDSGGSVADKTILADIARADPTGQGRARKDRPYRMTDTVASLQHGREWYSHLSDCFYHSDIEHLDGPLYYGGVHCQNSVHDIAAFAHFLDYLGEQVALVTMSMALCVGPTSENQEAFDESVALVRERRALSDLHRRRVEQLMHRTLNDGNSGMAT